MIDTRFSWLPKLLSRLRRSRVSVIEVRAWHTPIRTLQVQPADWGRLARFLAEFGARLSGLWAEDRDSRLRVYACLEKQGDYLLLKVEVPVDKPELASWSGVFPAANGLERHARDLLGIQFVESPDTRRWVRHQAWDETVYPLRRAEPVAGSPPSATPPDSDYPFHRIDGESVYEIPVGPVHAGIIEPGHFRFHAIGETVLNLEIRLGYVHRGLEKKAEGLLSSELLRLAGRVSGDSTLAHAWACARAMENAAGTVLPERAQYLRALLLERERVANHLGDIGAICNDVGFAFAQMQFSRLREQWLRDNARLYGHRLLMDQITAGGVACNPDPAACRHQRDQAELLRRELTTLLPILQDNQSLRSRLIGTGILDKADALRLGCLGYVGRASGCGYDVRRDSPGFPYDHLNVERPVQTEGDVAARVTQRAEEIFASLSLIRQIIEKLPHGPHQGSWQPPSRECAGLGVVEGWRGETLAYVRLDPGGRVSRYFPRDPSWFNWPALAVLIHDNIVPDFPVCNKSINGSYAGHDL